MYSTTWSEPSAVEKNVAYLLKARTVEPENQPLLGNARNSRGIVGNGM
jgi:hypothetical protein